MMDDADLRDTPGPGGKGPGTSPVSTPRSSPTHMQVNYGRANLSAAPPKDLASCALPEID